MLDDSNKLIDNEATIAKIFNDYFVNIASILGLKPSEACQDQNSSDTLVNHPSVKRIADSISANKSFSFEEVNPGVVHDTLLKLNENKTVTGPFSIKTINWFQTLYQSLSLNL